MPSVGIVSERDIVRYLESAKEPDLNTKVSEIMSPNFISCGLATKSSELMELMTEHKIRHVPILDNDQLVGMVSIGDVVKHKHFDFRGVIYDVDFQFNNSEEWYQSIPKDVRPRKDQPFYHLLAENNEITYEAYVSEQNLLSDDSDKPIKHPLIEEIFTGKKGSSYFKPSN